MSDTVLSVMKYRSLLKAELATVDGFLHMAEEFSKALDPEERLALMKTTTNAPPPEKPKIDRPRASANESGDCTAEVSGSATVGKNSETARKNDAVEGDDDLAARELKSEEQVSASRAKKNGSEPNRKSIFRRSEQ